MKILLIGFMGSGKTSVAQELSKKLNLKVLETDREILNRTGYSTISQLFAKDGEAQFRKLESELAKEIIEKDNVIISPGGGMIINEKNYQNLKQNSITFYLEADFPVLKERIEMQSKSLGISRPLFADVESAQKLYQDRLSTYKQAADFTISTNHKTVASVCEEILTILKEKNL